MEEDKRACVHLSTQSKVLDVPYALDTTAEDLSISICKKLGIGPEARHIFALRNKELQYWYPANHKINGTKDILQFRLRFKPFTLNRLRLIDANAYDYLFHQVRFDVIENRVPDIKYKHKSELIELGIYDMYRVMVEERVKSEAVLSEYKNYFSKKCMKKHFFFKKKKISNALKILSEQHFVDVKDFYFQCFEEIAPNYFYEEYEALFKKTGESSWSRVLLRVNADRIDHLDVDKQWITLCLIEDLCEISTSPESTLSMSTGIGTQLFLKFNSSALLLSFASALDGYYRFTVSWTCNLCLEVKTPSLSALLKIKCHGPVGKGFSYAQLKAKRGNRLGSYILRESKSHYNVIYLDVCGPDGKPRTHRIDQMSPTEFVLTERNSTFTSMVHLINSYQDPEGQLYLGECLPPSGRDNSELLICADGNLNLVENTDHEFIRMLLRKRPVVVLPSEIYVHKDQPLPKSREVFSEKEIAGYFPPTTVYKALWRIAKGQKLEVAIKLLKDEDFSKEFRKMATDWCQLKSEEFVRSFRLTFEPIHGMIQEFVNLGPLDAYLQRESQNVKTIELVKAATSLANAVFRLAEEGIVHGNLRCRKLLVHEHTDKRFMIKLADPGIVRYRPVDVHWLPVECYSNPEIAKRSMEADVWALGTVLWEIFARGATLPSIYSTDIIKKYYASGKRLPIPKSCSDEIYKVMTECWAENKDSRKTAQAIFQDLRLIDLTLYSLNRIHVNATAISEWFTSLNQSDDKRTSSLNTRKPSFHRDGIDESLAEFIEGLFPKKTDIGSYLNYVSLSYYSEDKASLDAFQEMFELSTNCNVTLQAKVGQGFYGEVYMGILKTKNYKPIQVAVKKLKMQIFKNLHDLMNKMDTIKTLKHPNIVEVLGVISEPDICLVIELLNHGSLKNYLSINRKILDHKKLLSFALDVSKGMEYLCLNNIVHQNLATRNILMADENTVKISDFFLTQIMEKSNNIVQTNRDLPIKWYAPESLKDEKFSTESDVWSFGVTMFEMFSFGEDPNFCEEVCKFIHFGTEVKGPTELWSVLKSGIRLPCPPDCPIEVYRDLMTPCWAWDSHLRPNFATLCIQIEDRMSYY